MRALRFPAEIKYCYPPYIELIDRSIWMLYIRGGKYFCRRLKNEDKNKLIKLAIRILKEIDEEQNVLQKRTIETDMDFSRLQEETGKDLQDEPGNEESWPKEKRVE